MPACSSLTTFNFSYSLEAVDSLVPRHLRLARLVLVPGHKGLAFNEYADALVVACPDGPAIPIYRSRLSSLWRDSENRQKQTTLNHRCKHLVSPMSVLLTTTNRAAQKT